MSIAAAIPFFGDLDTMDPMMGKSHQEEGFEWHGVHYDGSSHLSSPANEYPGYGFGAMQGHEMPQDHQFNRPMYSVPQPQHAQPVYPAQWPSMLTNPSIQHHVQHQHSIMQSQAHLHQQQVHASQMSAAPPMAPVTMAAPPPPPPLNTAPAPHQPPQRRTLTDQDRRRMCQYHEDNPSVKQTEIGAMFGVERSTVSKVLRQKEKYLFSDDGNRSPMKKAKGKFPDIERALSVWVRNHERKGLSISDKDIREKALSFAGTVGTADTFEKLNSNSWLEKFKQKNNLAGKARKGSDANDSDAGTGNISESQTPNGISPVSPSGLTSPSPISPSQSMEKLRVDSSNSGLGQIAQNYNRLNSLSASSLASDQSDTQAPAGPFLSDVSPADTGFSGVPQSQIIMTQANHNAARVRSQTFPMLSIDAEFGTDNGNLTPKQMHELMSTTLNIKTEYPDQAYVASAGELGRGSAAASNSQTPAQGSSPAVMPPPHGVFSHSAATSAISSPLVPPSQDEARKALELVMQFFQHQPTGVVDAEEYITMGKLMEKLKVQGSVGELPGGMHSIDVSSHQDLSRKRSINSL